MIIEINKILIFCFLFKTRDLEMKNIYTTIEETLACSKLASCKLRNSSSLGRGPVLSVPIECRQIGLQHVMIEPIRHSRLMVMMVVMMVMGVVVVVRLGVGVVVVRVRMVVLMVAGRH